MISVQTIYRMLGYAGLIPFVIPAYLVVTGSAHTNLSVTIAGAYAFGIICFLTGSWWGMGLTSAHRAPLLLSNLYFLVAFFIFLFALPWWPLASAVLLIGIFVAELNRLLFPEFPGLYRKMRTTLTLVASISMLAVHLFR